MVTYQLPSPCDYYASRNGVEKKLLLLLLQAANPMPIIPTSTFAMVTCSANPLRTIGSPRVVLVGSGSTRTASGVRSLFPTDRITHLNSNTYFKVANGVPLLVKFIGPILMRIPAVEVRSGNHGDLSNERQDNARVARRTLPAHGFCATFFGQKQFPEVRHQQLPQ
eukprot:4469482-Pleurochrysis_carterae.AAC.1